MKNIFLTLLIGLSIITFAQDPHLSQYDAVKMVLNPAETGMLQDANFRAATQFRNQWGSLGSKYSTSLIAFDMPVNDRWGAGAYIVNDDAAKAYNVFEFVGSGAYQISEPNERYKLMVGLQVGLIYKNLNTDKLIFDSQWGGGTFDEDLPSGETFNKDNVLMPEVNLGVTYIGINHNHKLNPYGGLGIFHATNPKESFFGAKDSKLPLRFQLNGGVIYQINNEIKLDPSVLGMMQGNVFEILVGVCGYYRLNDIINLMGGGYYRLNDAAIILLGLDYKNITFAMTYDINTSKLKQYTNGKGAIEFSVIFTGNFKKVVHSML
jgi:type IX secretion system PorP/SprF family membrane protein